MTTSLNQMYNFFLFLGYEVFDYLCVLLAFDQTKPAVIKFILKIFMHFDKLSTTNVFPLTYLA